MLLLTQILIALIAILHLYILVLEMFLWDKPSGLKAFGNTLEKARMTKVMAQNQGLYNGFLSAGLIWSLLINASYWANVATFFLLCIAIAGIYGAITASKKIIFIQTVPAVLALCVLYIAV